ncbi:hypothetical protein RV134_40065 [Roseovarius sp. EC-HK134]|jgi:hypothetical protein|nr:hypothetical protein [Roseovarius sp.]VVS97091.1 hypothetical protein RV420_20015 [Roseovarius sp. EC-SD190]VVT33995.1 hypothetical protein RV134_40065 [Roseovarius sp. EC-HK134]
MFSRFMVPSGRKRSISEEADATAVISIHVSAKDRLALFLKLAAARTTGAREKEARGQKVKLIASDYKSSQTSAAHRLNKP